MRVSIPKIGGSLLATGTILLNFASVKVAWWTGMIFMVAGPIMLGIHTPHIVKLKKVKKRKH